MSEESIKNQCISDNSFALKWIDGYPLRKMKFNGNYLKQDSTSLHKTVANLYITYVLNKIFKQRFHIRSLLNWSCEAN